MSSIVDVKYEGRGATRKRWAPPRVSRIDGLTARGGPNPVNAEGTFGQAS